ncbi:MAG: hypothetical protein H6515_14670 [Microthrixaceae bacterium]|jgi:hypothetical protein|nr:hypothetical protein [Microthrixaceae bacterium]
MADIVKVPLAIVKMADGSRVHLYEGAAVPDTADKEHVKTLRESGAIGKAPKVEPAPGPEAQTGKPTTVDDILAEVGDDVEKAKAALEVELVSEKPRKGVVEPLEKLIADAEAAAQ